MIGRLPPLNACRAFEAAARLGSFSRAGEELNVTAGAVSHQVKVLEDWIGRQLFRRRSNSVVLTDAARSLAPAINEALERLALGVEGLRGTGGAMPLTVSAQPDFALKWLIPRLPRFAALYPATELRLVTAYRALDLVREDIDLAVRYLDRAAVASGDALAETGGQLRADHLLRADLTPIASPALFSPGRPAALRDCTLLHVLNAMDDWRLWLAGAGVRGVDAARGPARRRRRAGAWRSAGWGSSKATLQTAEWSLPSRCGSRDPARGSS